jgi:hypothetical protein
MRSALAIIAALAATPGQAQQLPGQAQQLPDYGALTPFFSPSSPECVPVAAVEKAAVKTRALRETTFRFVQALYAMSPPQNLRLPPGDHAEIVTDEHGIAAAILIDGDQSCARLILPPPALSMVLMVDQGGHVHMGQGT